MPKIELLYFSDCPNIEAAKTAIRLAGVTHFLEVNLDQVESGHSHHQYSSPTILIDGQVVVGSQNVKSACSIVDWPQVASKIRNLLTHLGNRL